MIVLIPFERAVFTSMHDCKHVSANANVDYPFVTRSGRLKQKITKGAGTRWIISTFSSFTNKHCSKPIVIGVAVHSPWRSMPNTLVFNKRG